MAVNLFEGFSNRITGEAFRCVSYKRKSFAFEWVVKPSGYVPFEHIHLNQDEVFHIWVGELRILIDGVEHIGKPGMSIRVPKGIRHIAYNNKPEPLVCLVEYLPGLDSFKFFQCFGGLTLDNDMDKRGQISIPKMLYFTARMKARCLAGPTSVPAPLFRVAIYFFYLIGTLLNWGRLYNKYTGEDSTLESVSSVSPPTGLYSEKAKH